MTGPVRSIAELPFSPHPALELLNLHVFREAPDADYAAFGHARVATLDLESRHGGAPLTVSDALVLALHSREDGEPRPGDIELEFVIGDGSVTVWLSAFLASWLPRLPRDAGAIVLALCNPHHAALPRPAAAPAGIPVHYAEGDVESWLSPEARIRLVADAWRVAGQP